MLLLAITVQSYIWICQILVSWAWSHPSTVVSLALLSIGFIDRWVMFICLLWELCAVNFMVFEVYTVFHYRFPICLNRSFLNCDLFLFYVLIRGGEEHFLEGSLLIFQRGCFDWPVCLAHLLGFEPTNFLVFFRTGVVRRGKLPDSFFGGPNYHLPAECEVGLILCISQSVKGSVVAQLRWYITDSFQYR